ncbi:MAG: hypothetical protein ACE5JP_00810 [Candidatus Bipolaricaulia bacterium]
MTWTAYRVVLRLRSPLHIGHLKVGNLQRTRHYVPGKTLWGALTARLTREQGRTDYTGKGSVGEQVHNELAFSYFYPAIDIDKPLYPNYTDEGLCYGPDEITSDEFEWRLLNSYAATALAAQRASAEEGSLHETEFISPYLRSENNEEPKPVYLVGYVFEGEDCSLDWKKALDRLQLGGERKYGWGRVCPTGQPTPANKLFGYELDELSGERPVVTVQKNAPLLAHTNANDVKASGQIEPLIGRETKRGSEFGRQLSEEPQICWIPGSHVHEQTRLTIRWDGLWVETG